MGKLFVIMGKSATGKDTIYKRILSSPSLSLKHVISYTTRPIRSGEIDGVEYYFATPQQLADWQQEGKIIEHRSYQTMHGVWNYFTVDDGQIDLAKSDYLLIMTLEGYSQLRTFFGEDNVIPLYIELDDGVRLQRALSRELSQSEPKYAELCRRFLADDEDFKEENLLRLGIPTRYVNDDMETCVSKMTTDILHYCAHPD